VEGALCPSPTLGEQISFCPRKEKATEELRSKILMVTPELEGGEGTGQAGAGWSLPSTRSPRALCGSLRCFLRRLAGGVKL